MAGVLTSICLIIAAIIHLLPLVGLAGADRLTKLYGIPIEEKNLLILMRHRAVMFGLFGAFLVYAAVVPAVRGAAIFVVLISDIAFLVLARTTGGYNTAMARVVKADIVAIVALSVALVLVFLRQGTGH